MASSSFYGIVAQMGRRTIDYVPNEAFEQIFRANHSGTVKHRIQPYSTYRMPYAVPLSLRNQAYIRRPEDFFTVVHRHKSVYFKAEESRYHALMAPYMLKPRSTDSSRDTTSPWLVDDKWIVTNPHYVCSLACLGSIGVGKTTFLETVWSSLPCKRRSEKFFVHTYHVQELGNGEIYILPDFDSYIKANLRDSDVKTFPFHALCFYRELIGLIHQIFQQATKPFVLLWDRFFYDSIHFYALYAPRTSDDEYRGLVESVITPVVASMIRDHFYPKVNMVFFAANSPDENVSEILLRIKRRGRAFEQALDSKDILAYYRNLALIYSCPGLGPCYMVPLTIGTVGLADAVAYFIWDILERRYEVRIPAKVTAPTWISWSNFTESLFLFDEHVKYADLARLSFIETADS